MSLTARNARSEPADGLQGSKSRNARPALSLDFFAVPLGIAALSGTWNAFAQVFPVASKISDVLVALAGAAWLVMTAVYLSQAIRSGRRFADLRHARTGPFTAYIPVIGIIVATHYAVEGFFASRVILVVFVALLAVVGGLLLRHWIIGDIAFDAIHPGYFLPVVAGPFVASIGLSGTGLTGLAWAAFGVGTFFWVVIGSLVLSRLITGTSLPVAARPAISILMAPPSVGGLAWLTITGGNRGPVLYMILGVLGLIFLAQLALIPSYARTPFSAVFWAFTFPVCAASNLVIHLLSGPNSPVWQLGIAVLVIVVATSLVVAIAVGSIVAAVRRRRANELTASS